jgi:hypothetical protein
MDVFSMELGIQLGFVKTLAFREGDGGLTPFPPSICHCMGPLSYIQSVVN